MKLLIGVVLNCEKTALFLFSFLRAVVRRMRCQVTNLAKDIRICGNELLRAFVVFVALQAAVFTPHFAISTTSLGVDDQLQFLRLVGLVDN